jgi:hypothetical protein
VLPARYRDRGNDYRWLDDVTLDAPEIAPPVLPVSEVIMTPGSNPSEGSAARNFDRAPSLKRSVNGVWLFNRFDACLYQGSINKGSRRLTGGRCPVAEDLGSFAPMVRD